MQEGPIVVSSYEKDPVTVDRKAGRPLDRDLAPDGLGLTVHEQLTCGCHVHVEIASPDEGVAVLDGAFQSGMPFPYL